MTSPSSSTPTFSLSIANSARTIDRRTHRSFGSCGLPAAAAAAAASPSPPAAEPWSPPAHLTATLETSLQDRLTASRQIFEMALANTPPLPGEPG
eukprot:SAG22_NODE_7542_length_730_cov_0.767036_1_plen_94_part_10